MKMAREDYRLSRFAKHGSAEWTLAQGMPYWRSVTNASQRVAEGTENLDVRLSPESDLKPQEASVPRNEHTVLVVDDDPGSLHLVSTILRKHGFDVLSASSGLKGLNMLSAEVSVIRVVVLDYSMPQLDGGQTLKFMRQLNPDLKVIGLTAKSLDTLAKAYLDGVNWLVTKPLIATELVSAINALVGSGQAASSTIQS